MERRRYVRYAFSNNAYVILLADRHQKLGILVDIGIGGLACRYLADDEISEEIEAVELFAPRQEFLSEPIPCSTKSKITMPPGRSSGLIPMKRHSFHFESPSSAQRSQIEQFITLHDNEG